MIGIDTNVLVRYLAQNDPVQSPLASQLIDGFTRETPGFITQVVLVETVWVLTRPYKMSRSAIGDTVETLVARTRVGRRKHRNWLLSAGNLSRNQRRFFRCFDRARRLVSGVSCHFDFR